MVSNGRDSLALAPEFDLSRQHDMTALLDAASVCFVVLNARRRVALWNHAIAEASDISREDALGLTLPEIWPTGLSSRFLTAIDFAIERQLPTRLSHALNPNLLPLFQGSGQRRQEPMVQSAIIQPLAEFRGEAGCLIQVSDMSLAVRREQHLMRARRQAEAADRYKSEFLAGMSHELRTPLNAIIGFTEALLQGIVARDDEEEREAYLQHIHTSGQHLLSIINDMLDISAVENEKLELEEQICELSDLVDQARRFIAEQALRKQIVLEVDIGTEPVFLDADPRRLLQILLNLLSNAVKFTPKRGCIAIRAGLDEGDVLLEVRDNGHGMSADEVKTALQPYGQIRKSYIVNPTSTGLGLPLSAQLAALHGGELWIESEVGRGTRAFLRLPGERIQQI